MNEGKGSAKRQGNLDGIRVIDFAQILSGPYPCKLMSDMGADVIKVEAPITGERTRASFVYKNGVSGYFLYRNSSKRSISLNLKHPKGAQVFKDLIKVTDVLVQNHRVGVMDRLGLGYSVLSQINPRLIMVSISGYGQFGPMSDWPANDGNLQALSGATGLGGHADGPPFPVWIPWIDFGTGTHVLASVMAALYHRNRSGKGQHIDMAMLDVAYNFHDFAVEEYVLSEGKVNRTRTGPMHPVLPIVGVYECRNGYLLVSGRNWAGLCEVMGRPDLANDPRFDTFAHQVENSAEIYRLIAEWIGGYNIAEAKTLVATAGLMGTDILNIEEAVNHPYTEARELFVEMDHPQVGHMKSPNTPFRFSDSEARVRFRAPLIGEQNEEILTGLLGYSQEQIAELWENKAIYAEPAAR